MAAVTPDERRILMDYMGYSSAGIDKLTDYQVRRHLENYDAQGKTGFYSSTGEYTGPTADEAAGDWITDGLAESASVEGVVYGFRETAEAVSTTARQIGTGIQEAAVKAGATIKLALVAVVVVGGLILYAKLGK